MTAIDTNHYLEVADRYFTERLRPTGMSDDEWKAYNSEKVEISRGDLGWLASGLHYGCHQIRELHEIMTDLQDKLEHSDSPESMIKALEIHYKSVVKPVSDYCQAFYDWQKVIAEKVKWLTEEEIPRVSALPDRPDPDWHVQQLALDVERWQKVLTALEDLRIPIVKSSFLARHVYGRELMRTEQCPVHKGIWSGLLLYEPGACSCGGTGWVYKGEKSGAAKS